MKSINNYFHLIKSGTISRNIIHQTNPVEIRQILGLPDLHDTDRNCVPMHNLHIENEMDHIAKKMGSSGYKQQEALTDTMEGIGGRYGF